MRHRAKFRADPSNRSAMLDFQKLEILTSGVVRRPNLRHHAKVCEDRSNRSREMADFRFFRWRPSAI